MKNNINNNVIITGASSGIGRSLALAFAKQGYGLGLMARRTEQLKRVKELVHHQCGDSLTVEIAPLDVAEHSTVAPAIQQLSDRLGGVTTVIANAGTANVHRTGVNDFNNEKHVINVNLIGAMATVDAAASIFRQAGGGTIVGISSIAAYVPIPGSGAYSASKAGFSHYLKATQMELKKRNIQVTIVHPGFIETDIAEDMHTKPFVISADNAASLIVNAVVKKKANTVIPSFPWRIVCGVVSVIPSNLLLKVSPF